MRTSLLLPFGLALLAAGCDASGLGLGFGTRCAMEKQRIQRQLGPPDRVEEGVQSEIWQYFDENRAFVFSWDQEGENCVVSSRFLLPSADLPEP